MNLVEKLPGALHVSLRRASLVVAQEENQC